MLGYRAVPDSSDLAPLSRGFFCLSSSDDETVRGADFTFLPQEWFRRHRRLLEPNLDS
jgi:hypothetical protein